MDILMYDYLMAKPTHSNLAGCLIIVEGRNNKQTITTVFRKNKQLFKFFLLIKIRFL